MQLTAPVHVKQRRNELRHRALIGKGDTNQRHHEATSGVLVVQIDGHPHQVLAAKLPLGEARVHVVGHVTGAANEHVNYTNN